MQRRPGAILAVLVLALAAGEGSARAQEGQVYGADQFFDLVWEPLEQGGRFSIGGYVTNTYGLEARRVRLMVESLDTAGKVTAKTIGYVNYPIPPASRGYFEVFVPEKASRYRVFILSWDFLRTPSGS
jgi:hypothetical protein